MSLTFQECVIVPLGLWDKCKFSNAKESSTEHILKDDTLPDDVKHKLYQQERKFEQKHTKPTQTIPKPKPDSTQEVTPRNNSIVAQMNENVQPFARSILDKIKEQPEQISFNKDLEIVIDGDEVPNSNIVDILGFLLKSKIVTSKQDIPIASWETRKKLVEIGVPETWIKKKAPREGLRRKSQRHRQPSPDLFDQSGTGIMDWISF